LSREQVLGLRQAYFELFDPSFLKDGDARRGEFSGRIPRGLPPHGVAGHPAHSFVRSPEFMAFRALPVLAQMAEAVVGGPVVQLQRAPLRHFVCGSRCASRPHLDRTYLDAKGHANVTLWVPLGDCPIEAGGLLYLEGSHADPEIETLARASGRTDRVQDRRPLTNDLQWLSEATRRRWLGIDFEAGDVVLHSPDIVHASTDCQIPLMRLSTDIRFQRAGTQADPRWHTHWSGDDGH
jgi:ectoine hydroxylase-related dioxygenase (phytanoyl-CoA dioxygenase family)